MDDHFVNNLSKIYGDFLVRPTLESATIEILILSFKSLGMLLQFHLNVKWLFVVFKKIRLCQLTAYNIACISFRWLAREMILASDHQKNMYHLLATCRSHSLNVQHRSWTWWIARKTSPKICLVSGFNPLWKLLVNELGNFPQLGVKNKEATTPLSLSSFHVLFENHLRQVGPLHVRPWQVQFYHHDLWACKLLSFGIHTTFLDSAQ